MKPNDFEVQLSERLQRPCPLEARWARVVTGASEWEPEEVEHIRGCDRCSQSAERYANALDYKLPEPSQDPGGSRRSLKRREERDESSGVNRARRMALAAAGVAGVGLFAKVAVDAYNAGKTAQANQRLTTELGKLDEENQRLKTQVADSTAKLAQYEQKLEQLDGQTPLTLHVRDRDIALRVRHEEDDESKAIEVATGSPQTIKVSPGWQLITMERSGQTVHQERIWAEGSQFVSLSETGEFSRSQNLSVAYLGDSDVKFSYEQAGERFPDEIRSLAFAADGKRLIVGGGRPDTQSQGFSAVIDVRDDSGQVKPREVQPRFIENRGVASVAISTDGSQRADGSWNNDVIVHRADGTELRKGFPHVARVAFGRQAPSQSTLFAVTEDRTVHAWDLDADSVADFEQADAAAPYYQLAISADLGLLVAAGGEWQGWGFESSYGQLAVFDIKTRSPLSVVGGPPSSNAKHENQHRATILSVAMNGHTIATAGVDKDIHLWKWQPDVRKLEYDKTIALAHDNIVESVAFSPDGSVIVSGGWDGRIKIWNATDGKLLAELNRHTGHVKSVIFSDDGSLLASGGADGTVRFWSVRWNGLT